MMMGVVRLDGDRRRRAVGVDLSARGRDHGALQEPGQVEHRGMEGGERRRFGMQTHGQKKNSSSKKC